MIESAGELLAPREDVWALVAEPYHLPDWWPGYTGVRPDRRGLAENARWHVVRSAAPGFVRKPRGEGLIIIRRVVEGYQLRWLDVAQQIECGVVLDNAGTGRTLARVFVDGAWWRLILEGARGLPHRGLTRLQDLCQTTATLDVD